MNDEERKKETLNIIKLNNERHKKEIKNVDTKNLQDNNFLIKYPELAKEWYYEKNGNLKPWEASHGSNQKVWWLCPKMCEIGGCIHSYYSTINSRSGGSECGYCNGKSFCYHESLSYLFPEIAKLWHPNKNNELTPKDVVAKSHKRVWFRCPKTTCSMNCPHDFTAEIKNVVYAFIKNPNTNGCPFCAPMTGIICKHLSLAYIFPKIAGEIHPTKNNNIDPKTISPHSKKSLWFLCPNKFLCNCEHAYKTTVDTRTLSKNPTGCPFCGGNKVCEHRTLDALFPEIASEWDFERNVGKPTDYSRGSDKVVYWICPNDSAHSYQCSIKERTKNKQGCALCRKTSENVLNDFLIKLINSKTKKLADIKWGFYANWCKSEITKFKLPFDFLIKELNLIIELDGNQHFYDVEYFGKNSKQEQRNDVYKMVKAVQNNHSVIRLCQVDVRTNKSDWQNKLTTLINKCDPKKPSIYYIDNSDLYDSHKKLFKETMDNGGILPDQEQVLEQSDDSDTDNENDESEDKIKPKQISKSSEDDQFEEKIKPTKVTKAKPDNNKPTKVTKAKPDNNKPTKVTKAKPDNNKPTKVTKVTKAKK
jgi:hypothetical protein